MGAEAAGEPAGVMESAHVAVNADGGLSGLVEPTDAERARFLIARGGDEAAAKEMLTAYLEWRRTALPAAPGARALGSGLPMCAQVLDASVRCRNGRRILAVLGAMYDSDLGSADEYAMAIARMMDAALDRATDEKMTVVVDVRGGDGFANPRPWSVLPWMKQLAYTLPPNFPERLGTMLVLPVPWVAKALWVAASQLLDETTVAKCQPISGPASRSDPLPEGADAVLGPDALAAFETFRQGAIKQALSEAGAKTSGAASSTPPDDSQPATERSYMGSLASSLSIW